MPPDVRKGNHGDPGVDSVEASVHALFDAERAARLAHDELANEDPKRLMPVLQKATREALALDEDEASLRLVRIAAVLGELEGPAAVDLLIDILGSDAPEARQEAGEELSAHAWERFKDVALGVERALVHLPHGSPALLELPYILAEIPEPGVLKLLARFLAHGDAEVVATTIEALVETGDPDVTELLRPLVNDGRKVQIEDAGGTEGDATLGELASEAIEVLGGAAGLESGEP